jgi:integrase
LPGFGLRVFPTGRKSFVLWYRTEGRRKRLVTVGNYGAMTLHQARKAAANMLNDIRGGADPAQERQEARKAETVTELAEQFLERHSKPHKRSWRADERRLRLYVVPALGHRKLREVTRADVSRLHSAIGERTLAAKQKNNAKKKGRGARLLGGGRWEANRVLALLSVMFSKAMEWGFLPETAINPAKRVKRYEEQERDRFVNAAEMPALLESIAQEPSPYAKAAIELYLLLGLRRNELAALKWSMVDLDARLLTLPASGTKQKKAHSVPLPPRAVEILSELPRALRNEYVFVGSRGVGRPLDVKKVWYRVRDRAGLADVRLHDVRRTCGSWMAMSGSGLSVIGKALGHASVQTTAVYARVSDDVTRAALEAHALRIEAIRQPTKPKKRSKQKGGRA